MLGSRKTQRYGSQERLRILPEHFCDQEQDGEEFTAEKDGVEWKPQ